MTLPFRYNSRQGAKAGMLATRADIEAEWTKIKNAGLALRGHQACEPLTTLELDEAAIDDLIKSRLNSNETEPKRQQAFRDFETWPADAQLGLLSMAWAMGAGFALSSYTRFKAAGVAKDFDGAAAECKISETGNPGGAEQKPPPAREGGGFCGTPQYSRQ